MYGLCWVNEVRSNHEQIHVTVHYNLTTLFYYLLCIILVRIPVLL